MSNNFRENINISDFSDDGYWVDEVDLGTRIARYIQYSPTQWGPDSINIIHGVSTVLERHWPN